MQTANRRRTTWAISASLIAHLAVGIFLLVQHPTLVAPVGDPGPPQAIIPVLIVPRTPPPAAGRSSRRRADPPAPSPAAVPAAGRAPTAPIAAAGPAGAPRRPAAPGPVALHPAPLPNGPKGDARGALRQSYVGCANRDAIGLNRAERDFCDEQFGKGAKDAKFAGLGLDAGKQRILDAAVAKKESDYRYKHGTAPGGPLGAAGFPARPPIMIGSGPRATTGHAAKVPF